METHSRKISDYCNDKDKERSGHGLIWRNTEFALRICVNVKVKHTTVQALRLCTGRTAHRGSRGIALPFHDHGTRRGWGVSVTPRPLFTPGKDPVPIAQEAEWAPGAVWTGAENFAHTGIRSPHRPARSQSLYWLWYLTQRICVILWNKTVEIASICTCNLALINIKRECESLKCSVQFFAGSLHKKKFLFYLMWQYSCQVLDF
jgi:hypothetical protein